MTSLFPMPTSIGTSKELWCGSNDGAWSANFTPTGLQFGPFDQIQSEVKNLYFGARLSLTISRASHKQSDSCVKGSPRSQLRSSIFPRSTFLAAVAQPK